MDYHFGETLVRHCAATLAGHKCGSLFAYRPARESSLEDEIASVNARLCGKGVRVQMLKRCSFGGLVFVYRPNQLEQRLLQANIRSFLSRQGYADFSLPAALETLSAHIRCGENFPHEIGIFLDYPLADVIGFIEHKGSGFCCIGCWKVYEDEAKAKRTFALYRKCRDVYLSCYRRGFDVARLTVAA